MTMHRDRHAVFLTEMGLGPVWVRRTVETVAPMLQTEGGVGDDVAVRTRDKSADDIVTPAPSAWSTVVSVALTQGEVGSTQTPVAEMNWIQLKAAVSGCTKCSLCEHRTRTVFGVGDESAKWLFIGEGPGSKEDAKGEPFVGPAGKLLDNMLLAIGLKRGANAYIANIVKCRPTGANGKDRPPAADEVDACMPYLERQIALIQPTVIVALGKTAALSLLKRDPATPVSALRGTVHRYAGLPLIVTYHPAYLLRSPAEKRKTWVDLCLAMKAYAYAGTGAGE
jgi:uracil-DNA glycosylase family 4